MCRHSSVMVLEKTLCILQFYIDQSAFWTSLRDQISNLTDKAKLLCSKPWRRSSNVLSRYSAAPWWFCCAQNGSEGLSWIVPLFVKVHWAQQDV